MLVFKLHIFFLLITSLVTISFEQSELKSTEKMDQQRTKELRREWDYYIPSIGGYMCLSSSLLVYHVHGSFERDIFGVNFTEYLLCMLIIFFQ